MTGRLTAAPFILAVLALTLGTQARALDLSTLPASGGTLTHAEFNREAFSRPAPQLDAAQLRIFNFGNRVFNTNWTVAPASAEGFDGLGPTFNRSSCSGCHLRDGRGRPPVAGETELLSMLVRISVPGQSERGGPKAVPGYGEQINDRAIPGVQAEAQVRVEWSETTGSYADGTPYSLRQPLIRLDKPAFGAFPEDLHTSPRVAPAVFGLGLLEAIDARSIEAAADPDDRDGDGISGRVNRVYNPVSGQTELGRFGWKANAATLAQQNAGAALGDIGLTSRHFPQNNCPEGQDACRAAPTGGDPELADLFVDRLTQYVQTLGVPARRAESPAIRAGAGHFKAMGCASCHTPEQQTGANPALALLAGQRFAPFTDLLVHDMGPGLADGRPDFLADGREWRTAPLWGLGLLASTNGHTFMLHDGRARNFSEAILWHGGEAEAARERFRAAEAQVRDELVAFLGSL